VTNAPTGTAQTTAGRPRVVVTGMGIISPSGRGLQDAWEGVLAGKAAAVGDDDLVAAGTPVTIACRVPFRFLCWPG
jgi:3-oxoacyl-(acyl-carrier-protein) synthase